MRPTPFLRTTALASGMTDSEIRRAVRAGELERLEPGVYLHRDDALDELDRYRVRVRSVGAVLAPGTVISHESAAVLHGLALWKPDLTRVHVTRDRSSGGRRTASRHLHVAPLPADERSEVDGVPCTSLARTVVDLACTLDFDEAVIAGDCAAARDAEFGSALLCCLDESGPRRGIAAARRVAAFLDGRSESPGESLSRIRMHQAGMPAPTLQKEIRTPDGQFVARVDFLWEGEGVVEEFDGMGKYDEGGVEALRNEKRREDALRDLGFEVVRWTWTELSRFDVVRARFDRAVARTRR
ncbi:putative AbiEi antitoxin of type IV toxin-antitoxin system [Rhodococcus rhodochrous J45]|uniref:Putative AbiEi antitoxin of type IV toxin-antitoxin system n=1 Tax=Rhodococcus rhodochrous J45 TaxID=935266 RepID=A0A562D991_RHORH|nr:type IV toxin-antitoxin system AbiEi family antitoxin domain-containing protein [Rhodococcus rhodochrous]TWH06182.1 putative AbiEi antitoxin of type IV toxin-antitoxin system [Rhodococcus rhodochrous J45]